jgi:hypothetical protein
MFKWLQSRRGRHSPDVVSEPRKIERDSAEEEYSPGALRPCRHRLRDERRWLIREVDMQAFGPSTPQLLAKGGSPNDD